MTAAGQSGSPIAVNNRIVVVGASLAGMNAAQVLRHDGYEGVITVVGDELHQPYDRPPLSKDFLTTEVDLDRLTLAPARKADELDIELLLGRAAVSLDAERSTVTVAENASGPGSVNEDLDFDGLVIATGARARTLPAELLVAAESDDQGEAYDGDQIQGLLTLRTLDDARLLKEALHDPSNLTGPVVVCGAGFIGGEVAASARSLGHDVVLLEAATAPLTRVLDAEAGLVMADLHRSHGVDVRLATTLTAVHHHNNKVAAVSLGDGTTVETQLVIAGIGAVPNTSWLDDSDLTIDNGVVVDSRCRAVGQKGTKIVAAGDVARFPNRRFGNKSMRVEQWDNAVEMGRFAARSLLVERGFRAADEEIENGFSPVPWFWSDQYDRKIQLAGIRSDHATMAQGSFADHLFVRLYHDGADATADQLGSNTATNAAKLCGVLTWNRPRQAIIGRQLIDQGASLSEAMDKLGG